MIDVSFIIPAYNEEALIGKCITSLKEDIKNTPIVNNYEIIVVDNNCTDNTAKIATDLGCTVIPCKEKGVTHARQAGYGIAKYEFQAYIDADNEVPLGWLSNIEQLSSREDVACITGPVDYVEGSNTFRTLAKIFYLFTRVFHKTIGPSLQGGNFILRKSCLDMIGGHSINIDFYGEDTDLASRLSKVGKVILIPKMSIYSSARRIIHEGAFMTGWRYTINYLSVSLLNKPWTLTHNDIRPKD